MKLVDSVKRYAYLYDNSSREFSSWKMRELAWSEIAKLTGTTAGACKARWCSLRGRFIREYDKVKQTGEGTYSLDRTPTILQRMDFLKNVLDKRKLPHRQRVRITRESARALVNGERSRDQSGSQGRLEPEESPHLSSDETLPRINSARSLSKGEGTTRETMDPDLKFFASILPQMKKLPMLDLLEVKRKFLEDVVEALKESDVY